MKKMTILAVLCMCSLATAGEVKFLFGDKYVEADIEIVRHCQLSAGVLGAIDFTTIQSQPLKNYQVDIGDNYVGLYAKADLLDGPIVPYLAYKPMIRNTTMNRIFHVLEAGMDAEITKTFGIGAAIQWCRQLGSRQYDDVRFLVTAPVKF
jgi:hypothetical protein